MLKGYLKLLAAQDGPQLPAAAEEASHRAENYSRGLNN